MTTLSVNTPASARQLLQLIAACLTGILIPLSFTGPAMVLPAISHTIGGSTVQLNWVVNGYILTYGSSMMAAGSLADIYGRKRLWLCGLILFTLFTSLIAIAPSVGWIDVLRLLQGTGGAAAFAGAMSSLTQTFSGAQRTRVFSLLGTTFGIGLAFGPLVAGWLTALTGWRPVFIATAGISLAGLLLVIMFAEESRQPTTVKPDWPGAASFTGALALLTIAILQAPVSAPHSPVVIITSVAALLLFILFVFRERRARHPMLDLSLFRQARFCGVQLLAASPAFFFVTLIVLLPGYLIGVIHLAPDVAGRQMIALAAPLLVVPFIAASLTRWLSPAVLSAAGLLITAGGLSYAGSILASGTDSGLALAMLTIGTGIGLPWGLMDALAVSVVSPERAGMATGIFNCVRVSADGIAIAIVGVLLASLLNHSLDASLPTVDPQIVQTAANHLALGELTSATSLLPANSTLLASLYLTRLSTVMYVLSAGSVLTAVIIFLLLGQRNNRPPASPGH
ncbi:MFS transporter [Tatumella citrea]|uniref:MFS transporter n=1 Tax=Tatumella citrea TaxID=53336 RepID=A0A1Y0L999_TATCI|nr:MFS transporter [Tatumella citrea]ARU94517.1 MFS transporter [Tatumella citrea]ARU98556.1 MFS transporter [Tatumella citrea]